MPEPADWIRVVQRKTKRIRGLERERETAIVEASAAGASLRAIAAAASMTPEGVRQLLKREAR